MTGLPRKCARELNPGDVYRTVDGIEHTVAEQFTSGVRCYVIHDDGTERILFPALLVEHLSADPNLSKLPGSES